MGFTLAQHTWLTVTMAILCYGDPFKIICLKRKEELNFILCYNKLLILNSYGSLQSSSVINIPGLILLI